jgi:hypothetical protein
VGIILAALAGAKQTANMAKSQTRLKDIATYMRNYSAENREYIVPSRFDYTASAANYAVKVRSDPALPAGERHVGTWTDILWTQNDLGKSVINSSGSGSADKYRYDSPDQDLYRNEDADWSPFRSSEANSHDFAAGNGIPIGLPGGTGATESGQPGYFAANNFFNTDPAAATWPGAVTPPQWYVMGQIKAPDRSMHVVDSLAGETIDPFNLPWDNPSVDPGATAAAPDLQVDFRYNGACLMLFLDGHTSAEAPWVTLDELEAARKIKVRNLTQN